ncbi:uncharacterized protein BX664DRAFT_333686 [Halteromyces radiatus]|uniref:uncharacterized protein n=1 Tax=Halteromyces radiatus TaxID=101107 RepID=UPI0022210463|nr:uncharacterized protein BX664DRAFT_333686 [Halteromyces radiatus]KAI8089705.1 hypothetical protein BX664DRAFT_333686 [Halteromyces radiatus]
MMELDIDLMEDILARVDWKNGIRPLGDLATEACFVQKEMPVIKRLIGTPSISILVTQSSWTNNLVHNGVLSNLNDDTTMHALSELHLLFHTRQQQPGHRTLHHLHLDSQAYFSVNHILRPTIKFQKALDSAIAHLPHDQDRAWQELCKVWHDFGFLWPQKLILGQRYHVKHSYQVNNDAERVYQLHVAKDHTTALLDMKLRNNQVLPQIDSHHSHLTMDHLDSNKKRLRRLVSSWKVIKRDDIRPIYEFLPSPMRDSIHQLIKIFVHRIPINHPFLLRSVSTNGYLCWRLNRKQLINNNNNNNVNSSSQYTNDSPSSSSTIPILPTPTTAVATKINNESHRQTAPVLFSTLSMDLMDTANSSCIWQFNDKSPPSPSADNHSSATTAIATATMPTTKYVRCGNQLYLLPYLTPNIHVPVLNKNMVLTRSPYMVSSSLSDNNSNSSPSRGWDPYTEKASRVRSLELLDMTSSTQQPSQHYWTLETPDLGLDLDDDISTDGHLNVDIAIGRQKPILDREIISLRQVLYLCSVQNQLPQATSIHPSKRRSAHDASHSPPIVIPSPVPPAAAGVMAMVQSISSGDEDDERALPNTTDTDVARGHDSLPSTSSAIHKTGNGKHTMTANNIVPSSSSSTLPLGSTTTNTSQTTLPYYNLYSYTVLPQTVTSNISTSFSPTNSSSLASSPYQQHLHPVVAKEHSLINGLEESYWVIELLPKNMGNNNDQKSRQKTRLNTSPSQGHHQRNKGKNKDLGRQINTITTNSTARPTFSNKNDENELLTTKPRVIKMVMSSDTLRDDAQIGINADDQNDKKSIRRVQSYSSVQQHYRQQYQHGTTSLERNEHKQDNHRSQGILENNVKINMQPYLRLYASKRNNKTLSHFIKNSTLANLKRWLKSQ